MASAMNIEPPKRFGGSRGMVVFVYGTLKQGGCRHHHLGRATYLGRGTTRPEFRLFDCGTYPALVRSEAGTPAGSEIEGELWEIDPERLPILDIEEGVAERLYERVVLPIRNACGAEIDAATYLYLRSVRGYTDLGTRW